MEGPNLLYHEKLQKNLHDSVEKYVHTTNPIYTTCAMYDYRLIWNKFSSKIHSFPVVVVFEETVGIHIFYTDGYFTAMEYKDFVPFTCIKKVYVLFPSSFFTTVIIRMLNHKKHSFVVMKYRKFKNSDHFGNSGYLAFIKRLQEYAKSLS